MSSLRTDEAAQRYKDHMKGDLWGKTCALCSEEALQTFKFWKILKNNFPYDRIAAIHNMILPIRHVGEEGITQEEWIEYNKIKHELLFDEYEYIIEASLKKKSIPGHFHLHLIVTKP